METQQIVPDERALRHTLKMLFGDDLEVSSSPPIDISNSGHNYIGVFVNNENRPVAACVCDNAFVAYAGAALTMLPAAAAAEASQDDELPETMVDNVREIANICSRLMMNDHTPHLRLHGVYKPSALPSGGLVKLMERGTQVDYSVKVPQYGAGALSFVVT